MFGDLKLRDSHNVKFTPEGGLAIRLINQTGAPTIKGYIVDINPSLACSFRYVPLGIPDAVGVVYDADIANSLPCWVVCSGIADVIFYNTVTTGWFARNQVTLSAGTVGMGFGEAVPTPPFADDKHFQEIGHILDGGNPGMHKCVLHFN